MPTIILLDVSLSMSRPISSSNTIDLAHESRLNLAKIGLDLFLDYTSVNNRLEFTSLIVFSSLWEVKKTFTRDYKALKECLQPLEVFDKTRLEIGLFGLATIILDEWGSEMPCQVILVTDGSPGSGSGSLPQLVSESSPLLPLPFEHNLHIVLLANQTELTESLDLYKKLTDLNGNGTVHSLEGQPSVSTVRNMFLKLAETCHAPFKVTLSCGNMNSIVQMFPPPNFASEDQEQRRRSLCDEFKICGFLNTVDVSSPPTKSRHLILPVSSSERKKTKDEASETVTDTSSTEDGRVPSFCVLLHGSIKVENMVAVVQVGPKWYGIMYSWADTKKKANLILALFEPGLNSIPWLGRFDLLGPCSAFESNPYGENDKNMTPFPVKPGDKRSYASNPVVWIKASSLQSDIQKILRYARKLPDKMNLFYKELNRIRKAAMSLGIMDLLQGLSDMLERECTLLPGTAHPDAALQLTHAARLLTSSFDKEYNYNISPLSTNFTGNA